jgi:FlaA1/EpsC-like NDP-sugar epimerase
MAEHGGKLVVVAGGTGGIGRHIVDGILATKKHTVKIFSTYSHRLSNFYR